MNILDSSCWIEIFSKTPVATPFIKLINYPNELIVPTITLTEVFKKILIVHGKTHALFIAAQMEQGNVVDLTRSLALEAARLGNMYHLPLADSIIYATAISYNAILYTLDKHFDGLPNVVF